MQARIYKYVDNEILSKDAPCYVARPWVIEIDGKIKTNIAGTPLRYGTIKTAEEALLNLIEPCNSPHAVTIEIADKPTAQEIMARKIFVNSIY